MLVSLFGPEWLPVFPNTFLGIETGAPAAETDDDIENEK